MYWRRNTLVVRPCKLDGLPLPPQMKTVYTQRDLQIWLGWFNCPLPRLLLRGHLVSQTWGASFIY